MVFREGIEALVFFIGKYKRHIVNREAAGKLAEKDEQSWNEMGYEFLWIDQERKHDKRRL